jgi:hypothetical protein
LIVQISTGGIHSRFTRAIITAALLDGENVYLRSVGGLTQPPWTPGMPTGVNGFDFVLEQIPHRNMRLVTKIIDNWQDFMHIINSPYLGKIRKLASSLVFKKNLLSKVEYYEKMFGLGSDSLGVHLRFTCMDTIHSNEFTNVYFDDYVNKIKNIKHQYKNILVCSDNDESINKLNKIFEIKFVPNLLRSKTEIGNVTTAHDYGFTDPKVWEESFLEVLLLSKCGAIISRMSNVPAAAIILSNTIKTDYKLNALK